MNADEIRINPDTGLPWEEVGFFLAVSDRVWEHFERCDIVRTFGRFRFEHTAALDSTYPVGGVTVRIAARDDDGFSMTLADEEVRYG